VLELAILGELQEQPLHGYELKKRLSEMLGFFSGVSFGSLYPALRRLERAEAIEVVAGLGAGTPAPSSPPMPATGSLKGEAAAARLRLVPGGSGRGSGRRPRKAYRITPLGREHFLALLRADDGAEDERLFTLKLALCRYLDQDARLELLARRRAQLVDRLARARRSRRPGDGREDRYTSSLMEHRTRSIERDVEWIDDLIAQETSGPGGGDAPAGPTEQEGATA
jgi:DNA-binding PadR family transcriptional regulator